MPALYMSEELLTAVAEYEQGLGIRPGTFCAYDVEVDGIADLLDRTVLGELSLDPAELLCPWKEIAFVARGRPPTWEVAERLYAAGVKGARIPSSVQPGGVNLVLWAWGVAGSHVAARDPNRDLPHDGSSWPHRT